jgi:TIR domain
MPLKQCFVSYAHRDYRACDRVVIHLKAIGRALGFSIWTDHELRAGGQWSARLGNEIRKSSIFVLLVTNDFLASDYIQEDELPAIRLKREHDNALVIPIILRESGWQYLCDRYVQAIPQNSSRRIVPCFDWPDPEKAFAICAREVGNAAMDWFGLAPASPFGPKVSA